MVSLPLVAGEVIAVVLAVRQARLELIDQVHGPLGTARGGEEERQGEQELNRSMECERRHGFQFPFRRAGGTNPLKQDACFRTTVSARTRSVATRRNGIGSSSKLPKVPYGRVSLALGRLPASRAANGPIPASCSSIPAEEANADVSPDIFREYILGE